jgi:N-acylneuraminate cytidylyltransferase/CMP-N,N'-diacetyllegionaminic acid synthase
MRALGVVPARGGSKGIPRKNLVLLGGRPLLAYTAESALAASRLSRVILSTDDEGIAEVGRSLGLDVPFIRPPALAQDDTPTLHVLQHALRALGEASESYDVIVTLQPTAPFRRASDIDGALELLERTEADSVVSLVDPGGVHPFKMKTIDDEGWVTDPVFARGMAHLPRQTLPTYWLLEGSIYITRRAVLLKEGRILGERTQAWLVPREQTVNIDSPFDLWLAERMLEDLHPLELPPRVSIEGGSGENP